ncbi:MAG TPA: DegQ family serine endoprotease [Steroidobacteraceae bacterium]|jgi:serine protease Do
MKPSTLAVALGLAGSVTLALQGCSEGTVAQTAEVERVAESAQSSTNPPARATYAGSLPDFAPLVAQYGAAVVNVEVVQQLQAAEGGAAAEDNPLFEFFRRFGLPVPESPGGNVPVRGAGSGFIVSPDGYILTNAHVVAEADEVTVRLTDRREFIAKVVGFDRRTDVAVIKIDATGLPTVRIGDPATLRPGEWVLAIGSPFGLDNSATAGIVSATSRAVGGDIYVPFIQTDVAVNPGNSGGPLFNMSGEVVGMNSMIFSRTGGYMGLSFAIPIDVANDVRQQLIKTGRVVRGRIGVAVQDLNAQLAESFGLDRPRGALVSAVEEDSPAAKAGIEPGDVILSVNGREIERFGELSELISRLKPGTRAELLIWRDGKQQEKVVTTTELKEPEAERPRPARSERGDEVEQLGLLVRPLTNEEKKVASTEGTLLVEEVQGAAALAGVQPGDIILGVDGKPVGSLKELREAVKRARSTVALLIKRGEAQVFVPVRVG